MRLGALTLALLILLGAATARANAFDSFGFEPRGVAMGGAQTASGDDYVASYFNPSLLVLQKEVTFGFGFAWAKPSMDVHTQALADSSRLNLPLNPPDFGGYTLGLLFPLAGKVKNRVALGVNAYMPTNNMLRTEAVDPSMPHWYHYHSSPDRIVVATSVGIRVNDWLLVGGGLQFLGALVGGFDFRVNMFTNEFEGRALRNDLEVRMAPLAGVTLKFDQIGLRIAASYRGQIQLDYALPTTFDIADIGKMNLIMQGVAHFSPHTFTLGAQYRRGAIVATGELRYARWSAAPDPSTLVAMDMDGEALRSMGIEDALDARAEAISPGFVDTLSPHVGVEYWIGDRFAVRGGYSFRPTPVPLQNGDTNILDGNTHAISAGVGFSFDDPLEVFSKPVHIEAAAQRLIIPERRADKPNEGNVPSYVYSGSLSNFTLALRYAF